MLVAQSQARQIHHFIFFSIFIHLLEYLVSITVITHVMALIYGEYSVCIYTVRMKMLCLYEYNIYPTANQLILLIQKRQSCRCEILPACIVVQLEELSAFYDLCQTNTPRRNNSLNAIDVMPRLLRHMYCQLSGQTRYQLISTELAIYPLLL